MNRFDLAGIWSQKVAGKEINLVRVPGSNPLMGEYVLEREFELPLDFNDVQHRYFLCTEGVISCAEFWLNGRSLGTAGPWTPYRFEISRDLLKPSNFIQARIRDIQETFGPVPGRRLDGGLIRPLWIEQRPLTFLERFAFEYELTDDFSCAECSVRAEWNGPAPMSFRVEMTQKKTGRPVAKAEAAAGQPAHFRADGIHCWSPEMPDLYRLDVSVPGQASEILTEEVGFRSIQVKGQDLFLNGKRLVLKGVCRHEFTDTHGYCVPVPEIRRELAAIKQAGFNYIRLVHSPQSAEVPRVAAELGLLVSEEPGTCFHNLADQAIAAPAVECLRRLVLRDRNVPSVLAWYIYNECNPDISYAIEAAKACRQLNPCGHISFADCSGQYEQVRKMADAANLSWYGINIYDFRFNLYADCAKVLQNKPLIFTEWGGWMTQGNPRVLSNLCDNFVQLASPESVPRIAGCSFWAWADYEECSRPLPAAMEGWTIEGLVDKNGAAKPDLQQLTRLCSRMGKPPVPRTPEIKILLQAQKRSGSWGPVLIHSIGGDQKDLEARMADWRKGFGGREPDWETMMVSGIIFELRKTPLLLGQGRTEMTIPVGRPMRRIAILGHIALYGGYPASAIDSIHHRDAQTIKEFGSQASEYAFEFEDETIIQPLAHGNHILRGNNICRWWKTNPRSGETLPAVQAVIHPSFEILRLDLWEKEFPSLRFLKAIRWRIKDEDSIQALYAISVLAE